MARLAAAAAAALVVVVCLNEAEATGTRLMSMHEVMEQTTVESAVGLLFKKYQHQQHPRSQELVSLIQEKFAQRKGMLRSERVVSRHGSKDDATTAPPTGYAATSGVNDMLNEMIRETHEKQTIEALGCRDYNASTLKDLATLRMSVATFNSDANGARSRVLKASGQIVTLSATDQETRAELIEHKSECFQQIDALKKELAIVTADLDVMGTLLKMTECDDAAAAAASFFQTGAQASISSSVLVSCRHCNRGRGLVMLQDSKLQHMLHKLRSIAAQNSLNQQLHLSFQEASQRFEPVALTEVAADHMRRLARGARLQHRGLRRDDVVNISEVNISEIPEDPVPYDCQATTKCTLSAGSCENLRERFLLVAAGIEDKQTELTKELEERQTYCETQEHILDEKLEFLEGRIAEEQANLAASTSQQNQAESGSKISAEEFDSTSDAYGKKMGECCEGHNALVSEQCALVKIRGELGKLQGTNVSFTDCVTSDWSYEACDKTCGGGKQRMTRSILVHPNGGATCDELEGLVSCNTEACPVDCELGEWEGWSSCSAECGGGEADRHRQVLIPDSDGGEPCAEQTEARICHAQGCNKDCVLADWTEWTGCSRFCGDGHSYSYREEAEPARGTGTCASRSEPERRRFMTCTNGPCPLLMETSVFKCRSMLDIIVVLDGSGSLGRLGWEASEQFAQDFIGHLDGSDDFVKVALLLFSGPTNWDSYRSCTGSSSAPVDMKDCGIERISELTNDTAKVARMAGGLSWPRATTLTSVALGEAEEMLIHGREDAESLVIVITDGVPMSQARTEVAAESLKKSARLLWVPVGSNAPLDMIEKLASLPKDEHVVPVRDFRSLVTPRMINKILLDTCSNLVAPEDE